MNQSVQMHRIVLPVLAVVATLLSMAPAPAAAQSAFDNVEQLDVGTFVDAGIAVSQRAHSPDDTTAVVLATDANFPDGLTASAVAASVDGPVLFTGTLALPEPTGAEIDRLLDPGDTVYVMGGSAAVSPAITDALAEDYEIVRLEGPSRLETAAAAAELVGLGEGGRVILARAFGPEGANTTSDRTTGWVDAISCGAYAAAEDIPILLTQTEVLSDTTRAALVDSGATDVTVCGGTAAVSDAVVDELGDLGLDVARIEGPTRVETAVDSARGLFGADTAAGGTFVIVPGYGESFGYGLAAAPLGLPILLVGASEPTSCTDQTQPSRETLCYLRTGTDDDPAQLIVIGDSDVISDPVVDAVAEAAGGRAVDDLPLLAAPEGVSASDERNDGGTQLEVSWSGVADPDEILAGYDVFVDGERVEAQASGQPEAAEPDSETVPTTTGPGVTELTLDGLTADEEVAITVVAVDLTARASEASEEVLATPLDEVPTALRSFQAQAGDTRVTLTWEAGPVDTASYLIERATSGLLGCTTYEEVERITNRDTTTYSDEMLTNGTEYCYRISVTDAADQTSPITDAEPVTPNVGVPQVTVTSPERDTAVTSRPDLFFGQDLPIAYQVTDTDTPPGDLRATWQISYDAGITYTTLRGGNSVPIAFTPGGTGGAATFVVRTCTTFTNPVNVATQDLTSTDCLRDQANSTVRLRVTVSDATNAARVRTDDLELVRTPGPVTGFAGTGGPGQVTLVWDRLANITVQDYRIRRAEVMQEPDSEAGAEVCPADGAVGGYEEIAIVPQPTGGAQVTTADGDVMDDSGPPLDNDIVYCYLIEARRTATDVGESALTAANPDAALQGSIVFRAPTSGGIVRSNSAQVLRYDIDLPDGVTADGVRFEYCLDFRPANPLSDPSCRDAGGFTNFTSQLASAPSSAEGSRQVTWNVPALSQPDAASEGGALRVTLLRGDAVIASNLVVQITFV